MILEATIEPRLWFEAVGGAALLALIVKAFIDRKKRKAEVKQTNTETTQKVVDMTIESTKSIKEMVEDFSQKAIAHLETKVEKLEAEVRELKQVIADKDKKESALEKELQRKEDKIHETNNRNKQLETENNWMRKTLSEDQQKAFILRFGKPKET